MKEPLLLKKPPLNGNSRAERRGFERKMRVSQLWIHKETVSRVEFTIASAKKVLLFRFDSQFGK